MIKMNKKDIFKVIGIFYLFFASYSAYLLREKFSLGIFILILIICIFTDLGGYIFGKTFKGPKLTKISPKKTYAGAIGSFILSLIAAIIFTKYTNIGIIAHTNLSLRIGNNLEFLDWYRNFSIMAHGLEEIDTVKALVQNEILS